MKEANVATFSQFAALLRVKPSAITALRQAGRLVLTDDGKHVLIAESQQRLQETADPSKAGVVARHAAHRTARDGDGQGDAPDAPCGAADSDEDDDAEGHAEIAGYQSSRAKREHYLALAAQRDYEQSMGMLYDADEVDAAAASAVLLFRSSLERWPDVLSPQLAPVTDETQVRAILSDAVEYALGELARQFGVMVKGGDHARD